MIEKIDLLAVVLMGEVLPITREARGEMLRHLSRCVRAILARVKGGEL